MTVITPRATVAVLAAGYRPVLHPSALAGLARSGAGLSYPQDQPVVRRLVAGLLLVAEHVGGHVVSTVRRAVSSPWRAARSACRR